MSQLQALHELYVGANKLQYSDVEFIIESFPQLTGLGIDELGLTGRFLFRKSRTSATSDIVVYSAAGVHRQLAELDAALSADECSAR
jgi:hypothetical protein